MESEKPQEDINQKVEETTEENKVESEPNPDD